jgi:broad specificity phosphatase PhoE
LAGALGKKYSIDNPAAFLISSHLRRAVRTASFLKGSDAKLKTMSEFAEMDFGLWDGLSREEISLTDEALYRQWVSDPMCVSPPGGETMSAFKTRIESGLSELRKMCFKDKEDPGREVRVILVTHGGAARMLLCILLDLRMEKFWRFNIGCAEYSVVRIYESGFSVLHKLNVP